MWPLIKPIRTKALQVLATISVAGVLQAESVGRIFEQHKQQHDILAKTISSTPSNKQALRDIIALQEQALEKLEQLPTSSELCRKQLHDAKSASPVFREFLHTKPGDFPGVNQAQMDREIANAIVAGTGLAMAGLKIVCSGR